jgi:hypothetical protein
VLLLVVAFSNLEARDKELHQTALENAVARDAEFTRSVSAKKGWHEDQMIFRLNEKEVSGTSAVKVVRALEREDKEYRHCGGSIRQYLSWSLNNSEVVCRQGIFT